METKKPTNAQLQKRIARAIIHLDKTKDTKEIYFDDKCLRLVWDEEQGYAVVGTMYHMHTFLANTSNGVSRPFLYVGRFIDIALNNDCTMQLDEGNTTIRSYAKLMHTLKEKEDKTDYNIAFYVDMWLMNIFAPLYGIDESEASAFIVYEQYMHNIAKQSIILSEKENDMTNKQFVEQVLGKEKEFLDGVEERVLFHKLTDEERREQEANAIKEQLQEEFIKNEKEK